MHVQVPEKWEEVVDRQRKSSPGIKDTYGLELIYISAVVVFCIFFICCMLFFLNVWGFMGGMFLSSYRGFILQFMGICKAHAINKGQWEFYNCH